MTEQEIPQEQLDVEPVATAPANWTDVVRQHITGPVFSLAFHKQNKYGGCQAFSLFGYFACYLLRNLDLNVFKQIGK